MLRFLKREQPNRHPPDVRAQLKKIVTACRACVVHGAPPRLLLVSIPHDEGRINQEIIVDIFSVNKRPVLRVIDRDTRFSHVFTYSGLMLLLLGTAL